MRKKILFIFIFSSLLFAQENNTTNSPAELYALGLKYFNGKDVEKNPARAFDLFKTAARAGNADAQLKIGIMFQKGIVVSQNCDKAFYWVKKSAEQNQKEGQNLLGCYYAGGIGTQTNNSEAIKWFEKSAAQNFTLAKFNLGYMYQYGYGCKKNITNAFEFYLSAAHDNYYNAKEKIGWIRSQKNLFTDIDALTNLYYYFAEKDDQFAQYGLGHIYYYGTILPEDDDKALEFLLKAAEKGITNAFFKIGYLYQKKKSEKAVKWYEKAAEAGFYLASSQLGLMYSTGKIVKKDYKKAEYYLRKVIESDEANNNLKGSAYMIIGGIMLQQKKSFEGFKYLKKAAVSPIINKLYIALMIIGFGGGIVGFTTFFIIIYFIMKKSNFFEKRKTWSIIEAIFILALFLFLQMSMSVFVIAKKGIEGNLFAFLYMSVLANVIVFCCVVYLTKIRQTSFSEMLGFRKVNFKKWFLYVVCGWISVMLFSTAYEHLLKFLGIEIEQQFLTLEIKNYHDIKSIIIILLIGGIIVPFFEEIIFRGVIFQALRGTFSVLISVLVSSIIFAAIHLDIKFFVPILVIGGLSAYSFEKTKSIYTSLGIHILNNLFTISVALFFLE